MEAVSLIRLTLKVCWNYSVALAVFTKMAANSRYLQKCLLLSLFSVAYNIGLNFSMPGV